MSNPKIAQKRPYVKSEEAGNFWFCACGESSNQPYCDGKHKVKGEFRPIKVELEAPKTVAWCGCKNTKNGAFCDGTHAKL